MSGGLTPDTILCHFPVIHIAPAGRKSDIIFSIIIAFKVKPVITLSPDVDERDDNGKAYYNNNKFCIFITVSQWKPYGLTSELQARFG